MIPLALLIFGILSGVVGIAVDSDVLRVDATIWIAAAIIVSEIRAARQGRGGRA